MSPVRKHLVLGLMMVLALSACGTAIAPTTGTVVEPNGADGDAASTEAVEPNDLEVGDCWNPVDFSVDPSSGPEGIYSGVEPVPCRQPHTAEVYVIFDLEGTEYPDDEGVVAECQLGCLDGFEEFVGREYADSALDVNVIGPSRKSWTLKDDRTVVCSVFDNHGEPLTGSMEGSER